MTKPLLYLVGTVHTDPDGRERLASLLERLSPQIIAVEYHKDRIKPKEDIEDVIRELKEKILAKEEIILNERQRLTFLKYAKMINNSYMYELEVSKDHTQRFPDSRLELIDLPVFTEERHLRDFKES